MIASEIDLLLFRSLWRSAAILGHCDALDGAEYRRAWQEWLAASRPQPLLPWLRAWMDDCNRAPGTPRES